MGSQTSPDQPGEAEHHQTRQGDRADMADETGTTSTTSATGGTTTGAQSTAQQSASTGTGGDTGFPTGTPLEQMTGEQREAYWKHQARKHEQRVKDFGGLTAEDLKALRDKAQRQDALEDELASDKEKAVKEARTATQQEADARYQPLLAETAFRIAIGERKTAEEVADFISDLNLKNFINEDGTVNTAKVLTRSEQFAPVTGTSAASSSRGPLVMGHSSSGSGAQSGEDARRYMEQRFGKQTQQ